MESVKIPELLNGWPWVPLSKRNGITGEDSTLIAFYWEATGKTNLHPSFQSFNLSSQFFYKTYLTLLLLSVCSLSFDGLKKVDSVCLLGISTLGIVMILYLNLFPSTGTLGYLQNGQFGSCWRFWWWEETVYVNARPGIPNISFKSLADDPKL